MIFRTHPIADVWYSLGPALIPPDESADWLDLQRHHEDGTIVMGRFKGVAAAVSWAWQRHGVEPALWYQADELD